MPLQPGAIDVTGEWIDADCMAKYIEDSVPSAAAPNPLVRRARREFYIGLSRGIIEYLKAHDDDSFVVTGAAVEIL